MNKKLVCNQKMFLTYDDANLLKDELSLIDKSKVDLVICPSFLNFDIFKEYDLGSQDLFYENKGPFTGEISAYDLSLRGIKYSIIGHAEREKYDTEKTINKKIKAALINSITPIICVGESKIDKELRKTAQVIRKQIISYLKDISLTSYQEVWIAYEPKFLIGGTKVLSKEEIEDVMLYIKKVLESINITNYKLLYGASINSKNINDINSDLVDGYLLGASCIDINELKDIIKCIK